MGTFVLSLILEEMVTKHRADLPVLCGCFPLAVYFTLGSVYMSMPLSHFVLDVLLKCVRECFASRSCVDILFCVCTQAHTPSGFVCTCPSHTPAPSAACRSRHSLRDRARGAGHPEGGLGRAGPWRWPWPGREQRGNQLRGHESAG